MAIVSIAVDHITIETPGGIGQNNGNIMTVGVTLQRSPVQPAVGAVRQTVKQIENRCGAGMCGIVRQQYSQVSVPPQTFGKNRQVSLIMYITSIKIVLKRPTSDSLTSISMSTTIWASA